MPAAVPAATLTAPVVVFNVTFGLVVLTCVMVTFEGTTATPFNKSLVSTLDTATPPVTPLAVPASATASITAAVTGTVTTAGSQFVGFRFSQIW